MDHLERAKANFLEKEKNLSKYATRNLDAIRFKDEKEDIRPAFFHDIDRIIHSMSYTRYINKTQVYSEMENDHISRRMTHVQLVSKIARTIGRALLLNEDLIEAIALGHDIGHTPLGHNGETMIAGICKRELNEDFAHNIQGVRYYMDVAKDGSGYNLTLQVLDGILFSYKEDLMNKINYTNELSKRVNTRKDFNRKNEKELEGLQKLTLINFQTKDIIEEEKDKEDLKKLNEEIKEIKNRKKYEKTPNEIFDQIDMLLSAITPHVKEEATEVLEMPHVELVDSTQENQEEKTYENRIKVIEMIPVETIKASGGNNHGA